MITATLTMEYDDGIVSSLSPEAERPLPRTEVALSRTDGDMTITITASDTSAMRAALNSYLGWIRITENIDTLVIE